MSDTIQHIRNSVTAATVTDSAATRIVVAAREEFERYGIRRTTVEQIASRAGVSRVTVYRRFDGKAGLVRAVVLDDLRRFAESVTPVWQSEVAIEDGLVEILTAAVLEVRRNPLFNTLLHSEPDGLLQQLTLDGEEIFDAATALLASRLKEHVEAGDLVVRDVALASELVVRLGFTVVMLPFGVFPGKTEAAVRRNMRAAVMPILVGQAGD